MSKRKSAFIITLALTSAALGASLSYAQTQRPFHIEDRWAIGGDGGWDYVTVDSASHRLYIAHSTRVDVVDLTTGKVVGAVTGLTRCHGVVIAPDGKTGFVSDGGANAVVAFDPTTFATVAKIEAGKNPDGIVLEPATNTIWALNGGSSNATVIDITTRKSIATVPLPGRPEFPQADGHGTLFINLEDKNSIARVDAKTREVTATWPLAGCESPSGLALDKAGSRLFSVCDGKKMAITDAKTGTQLAEPTIGEGPDAAGYDATHRLAFASNGDGTLSVVDASKPGYPVVQTLATQKGARTMALDEATGRIYLAVAQFGKPEPGQKRSPILPNTFTILVVGRE